MKLLSSVFILHCSNMSESLLFAQVFEALELLSILSEDHPLGHSLSENYFTADIFEEAAKNQRVSPTITFSCPSSPSLFPFPPINFVIIDFIFRSIQSKRRPPLMPRLPRFDSPVKLAHSL